jgi:hypothetical protein
VTAPRLTTGSGGFRSDGHSYQYSSAVKFADVLGIDLGIDRNWGSTQRLYHNIAGNDQRLCGNNDVPATAGKIEVAWR